MEYESLDLGIPVIVYENNTELPTTGTFYVVAGNGLFLHKETGVVSAFVPVKNISVLKDLEQKSWVKCFLPKLPFPEVYKIKMFFQKVLELYGGEACVVLYLNKETEKYRIVVPKQYVHRTGVSYKRANPMEDYIPVGTIHSHCDFDAFHSGTDVDDEQDFDGLHVTFGHNHQQEFSITSSIAVNGLRQKIDPLAVLEGIRFINGVMFTFDTPFIVRQEWIEEVDTWLKQVTSRHKILAGDIVTWAKNMPDAHWKSTYGVGPFDILEIVEDPTVGKMARLKQEVQNAFTVPLSFLDKYENS